MTFPVTLGEIDGEPFGVLPDFDEADQHERVCEPLPVDARPEPPVWSSTRVWRSPGRD